MSQAEDYDAASKATGVPKWELWKGMNAMHTKDPLLGAFYVIASKLDVRVSVNRNEWNRQYALDALRNRM